MEEAQSAMTRLCDLVEQVLASNQDMSRRLRNMDAKPVQIPHSPGPDPEDDASTTSSRTITPPPPGLPPDKLPEDVDRSQFGFAFEEDLLASRVYRKPLFSDSKLSLVTSAARTTASSVLSALSLTDVSNISILAVPIYGDEISNQGRYEFGDFDWEPSNMPEALLQRTAVQSQKNTLKANRWEGFANAVWRRRLDKASNMGASQEPIQTVLGVSLSEVNGFADTSFALHNEKGESFVCGNIPIYIAEIGEFLKWNGMLCRPTPISGFPPVIEPVFDDILIGLMIENIFCVSGSPLRLQNLQDSFNKPPRYGEGIDWSGYTVHDAASTMLRFLNRLPEPVIPPERYEAFQNPLKQHFLEWKRTTESPTRLSWLRRDESIIQEYKHQLTLLPEVSRQLLLYLVDLFGAIANDSESNQMTSSRIAKVFQPVILSPVKAGEYFIEEDTFSELSQHVLTFLIDYQDYFVIGMAGTTIMCTDGSLLACL